MNLYSIIAIAIALAMDAMAVAIAGGITLKSVKFRQYFRLSWHFGFFQALMPVIGWGAGLTIRGLKERFDHWIAFCLLHNSRPLFRQQGRSYHLDTKIC